VQIACEKSIVNFLQVYDVASPNRIILVIKKKRKKLYTWQANALILIFSDK
jgi:hypothetical protein